MADFLAQRDPDDEDHALMSDVIEPYIDSSVLDYSNDMVYATIEIKFEKTQDGNIIKSFIVRK